MVEEKYTEIYMPCSNGFFRKKCKYQQKMHTCSRRVGGYFRPLALKDRSCHLFPGSFSRHGETPCTFRSWEQSEQRMGLLFRFLPRWRSASDGTPIASNRLVTPTAGSLRAGEQIGESLGGSSYLVFDRIKVKNGSLGVQNENFFKKINL